MECSKALLMAIIACASFVTLLLAAAPAVGAVGAVGDFYVSPEGNDAWSGRLASPNEKRTDGPLRTLDLAARSAGPGDTCHVRAGVYHETLKPHRSGGAGAAITFRNYRDETPVITGADPVTGWRREGAGVHSAAVEWDLGHENQVFAGGAMLTEARWPTNTGTLLKPSRARVQKGTETTITDPKLPGGPDAWKGALLWCAGGSEWICWTARVTAYDAKTHTLTFDKKQKKWYRPRRGNPYVLMGLRSALDSEGEWWYDSRGRRLYLMPPGGRNPNSLKIEMKRRAYAIDLAGRSHVRVTGLRFRSGGLRTDKDSSDIVLQRLKGEYVGHSYEKDVSSKAAVLIRGSRIEVTDSEFAYASGSVVSLEGRDNRIVNCFIHDGNYGAKWRGTLGAAGRGHVIAYNTVRHSGRDLVNVHGLSASLIEHNDLSDAGWLTSDLGMTYGHNTDFDGTVIRRNLVHDNHAPSCSMGIYFDHLSHNVIVHNNVVWNVKHDPIRINNPSYFDLVFNNTCWRTGRTTTFDHSRRGDLFGTRYQNNIMNQPIRLPDHVAVDHNLVEREPSLVDPARRDFAPKADSAARGAGVDVSGAPGGSGERPDIGALKAGEKLWRAGHDFSRPAPKSELTPPRFAHMNVVRNACFELETLEHWEKTGARKATLAQGNGWGNGWGGGKVEPTGTSKRELKLGPGRDGVRQRVEGLAPRTRYRLSAWLKVSSAEESVGLSVTSPGGKVAVVATNSTGWVRKTVEFETGARATTAVVSLEKTSTGPGSAWCDNVGLPQTPVGR
jgi:hypothetical protein